MPITRHNPETLFPLYRNYSHSIEVSGNSRLLFISGLNGYLADGTTMPDSFEEQGEIIWGHIGVILKSADMTYDNIVSLRTYLSSPEYDEANVNLCSAPLKRDTEQKQDKLCSRRSARWPGREETLVQSSKRRWF